MLSSLSVLKSVRHKVPLSFSISFKDRFTGCSILLQFFFHLPYIFLSQGFAGASLGLRNLSSSSSGQVIGVRKEDKNRWERRAPLSPANVKQLTGSGVKVLVEASDKRIFPDIAYQKASPSLLLLPCHPCVHPSLGLFLCLCIGFLLLELLLPCSFVFVFCFTFFLSLVHLVRLWKL